MVFFHSLSVDLNSFLKGKTRVKLTFKIGLTNAISLATEFCRKENFIPVVKGLPGKRRLILMSELKLVLKYSGFIGSRLFFDVLSEIKLTFDAKFQ